MGLIEQATRPDRVIPMIRFLARRDWTSRAMTKALAPFNPLDPRRYSDPYPLYEQLRAEGPVFHHRRAGTWFVTGHAECEELLRGPVVGREAILYADLDPSRLAEARLAFDPYGFDARPDLFEARVLDPPR